MDGKPNWLEEVYQLKLREFRAATGKDQSGMLGDMKAGTSPGADLEVLRSLGGVLLDRALKQCEAGISELAKAHVKAGDREALGIVDSILKKYVNVVLGSLPGASLYASVRGGAHAVALGEQLRQSENARFLALRHGLVKAVRHYVVVELGPERESPKANPTTRTLARAALAKLYLVEKGDFVAGTALRGQLLKRGIKNLEERRALVLSLHPDWATRRGSGENDLFQPTLTLLCRGSVPVRDRYHTL